MARGALARSDIASFVAAVVSGSWLARVPRGKNTNARFRFGARALRRAYAGVPGPVGYRGARGFGASSLGGSLSAPSGSHWCFSAHLTGSHNGDPTYWWTSILESAVGVYRCSALKRNRLFARSFGQGPLRGGRRQGDKSQRGAAGALVRPLQ